MHCIYATRTGDAVQFAKTAMWQVGGLHLDIIVQCIFHMCMQYAVYSELQSGHHALNTMKKDYNS